VIHLQSAIEITASLVDAFRLLTDSEAKARLNPGVEVVSIIREAGSPLVVGARTFFSLRTPEGVQNFYCEITAFENNHFIEWISDTLPSFRVRESVELTATGCLLTHEEWFDEDTESASAPAQHVLAEIADAFQLAASMNIGPVPGQLRDPAIDVQEQLHERLSAWLANIKRHLEDKDQASQSGVESETVVAF